MAGQLYVKLDGVDGGSQDDNFDHKDSFFDAESFDFGGSINFDQDAHRATGRTNYDLVTFTLKYDRMLATLFDKMNTRASIDSVIIHWVSTADDGSESKFLDLTLENAKVISVNTSLQDEGGNSLQSLITVSVAYASFTIDTADSHGDTVSAAYDVVTRA